MQALISALHLQTKPRKYALLASLVAWFCCHVFALVCLWKIVTPNHNYVSRNSCKKHTRIFCRLRVTCKRNERILKSGESCKLAFNASSCVALLLLSLLSYQSSFWVIVVDVQVYSQAFAFKCMQTLNIQLEHIFNYNVALVRCASRGLNLTRRTNRRDTQQASKKHWPKAAKKQLAKNLALKLISLDFFFGGCFFHFPSIFHSISISIFGFFFSLSWVLAKNLCKLNCNSIEIWKVLKFA